MIVWDEYIVRDRNANLTYLIYNELAVTKVEINIIIESEVCYLTNVLLIKSNLL